MERRIGARFSLDEYIMVDMDAMEVTQILDGEKNVYVIGAEGIGSSSVDLRNFKSVMTVGETQQLNVTLSEGATARYLSAAPSKFRVDENGLITAVGAGTASRLRIETYDTKNVKINEIVLGITVEEA